MIPFSPPRIDDKTVNEVKEALLSGWITTGPKTKLFEKKITQYCGHKTTVCVSSATSGMEMLLRWWGIGPGDEVILPAYTYCSTINVVLHVGADPVLVDTAENSFNISIKDVASKITNKTKAIVPVDISGFPCDYDELYDLVNQDDIKSRFEANNDLQKQLGRILIMADAAHSFGAVYKGKRSGSLADVSVFSFHAVKNLTTAEGGAICINLPEPFDYKEIYKKMCVKILHGQSKDALAKTKKGAWKYDVVEPGYKCNMTDLQAAIGLVELERYEETLKRRAAIFEQYNEVFEEDDRFEISPSTTNDKTTSYHLYLLRVKNVDEATRDLIIQEIFEQEVSVNVHFQPLPNFSAYKNLGFVKSDYPNTYQQYSTEITLPVYYDLTDEQVQTVISAVKKAISKCMPS